MSVDPDSLGERGWGVTAETTGIWGDALGFPHEPLHVGTSSAESIGRGPSPWWPCGLGCGTSVGFSVSASTLQNAFSEG